MYLNKNKHIISYFLIIAAAIKIAAMMGNALARQLLTRGDSDIAALNTNIAQAGLFISFLQFVFLVIAYIYFYKKIRKYKNIFPVEEQIEIAKLQAENLKDGVSVLNINQTEHMLKLWGFILIMMQLISDVSTKMYENLIMYILSLITLSDFDASIFVAIYNSSHGFKYICMMTALIIGTYISSLFLDDRVLKIAAFVSLVLFMVTFRYTDSTALSMLGREMIIVWTSVLFHISETIGLLFIAIYIRIKYKGM